MKTDKLTVTINDKEFEIEQEVFDLIHRISLERDELEEKVKELEKEHEPI